MVTAFPIISLRSKFGIKRLSSFFQDVFIKDKLNSSLNMPVFTNWDRH